MTEIRVGFIGAGNMTQALIEGLVQSKGISPANIMAADPAPTTLSKLAQIGVRPAQKLEELVEKSDLIVLAIKPQVAEVVLSQISSMLTVQKILLSVMAGFTTSKIESYLREGSLVIRCMPQTLVRLGMGSCAICSGTNTGIEMDTVCQFLGQGNRDSGVGGAGNGM